VAELCSRAIVMRNGRIVEDAPVDDIFHAPKDPYTKELLRAVPRLTADR
jgi:ABC-type dipeptide/oligopeptide/nickel transport system ATPase component